MTRTVSRIAAVLLSLVFVFALFPGLKINAAEIVDQGECGDNGSNVTWTLDNQGTLTISGTGAVRNYTIANTNQSPFFQHTAISKVVIENGVTHIGSYCFYMCSNIIEVSIPNTVTSIGEAAFDRCTKLASISIPDSVTSIGEYAFEGNSSLISVKLSNNLTSIAANTFVSCSNLKSLTIPESVTSIGKYAFYCCGLTSIIIPESVQTLGDGVFSGCSHLTTLIVSQELYENYPNTFNTVQQESIQVTYNATYTTSTSGGSISGDAKTNGTNEITVKPDENYVVDKIVFSVKDKNGADVIQTLTPTNGKYILPTYDFKNWTGDCKVTASFKLAEYTVVFKDSQDKERQSTNVTAGSMPSYTGATPTRKSDNPSYYYEFDGWAPAITKVTGPQTYTAQFIKKDVEFKVTFNDLDGNELQSGNVKYGGVPVYSGKTPEKAESETSTFSFVSWTDGTNIYTLTGGLPEITAAVTFTPVFKEIIKPVYTVGEVKGDGINSDIVIDVHRNVDDENCIDYFSSATIDGTEMKVNEQYTVTKGSTIITIKKNYLSTMTAGEHEVKITFSDGSISTKVTVAAKANTNVPATGESTAVSTYTGLALIVAACVCGAGFVHLKKRKEA